jgi:hypothetical protein
MRELLERRDRRALVPFGGPPGECRLSFHEDGILVERADPHVWLTEDFLHRLVATNRDNEWVSLTYGARDLCDPMSCCQSWRGVGRCYIGAILAIWGTNHHVHYRITAFRRGIWEARWAGHER